jgi:predicted nucleic acid-binding protein
MSSFTAVYDACVLYPAPLRDLLIQLATIGEFRAKWSDDIHDEWTRSVLRDNPKCTSEQLARTRRLMDEAILDCNVDDYQELIPALTLPDADDRHVLAVAIRSGADVIVTFNLKDFPASRIAKYGIDAQHPDEFIMHLMDLVPHLVCRAVKAQRQRLKNPPMSVEDLLDRFERQGLAETVAELRKFRDLL